MQDRTMKLLLFAVALGLWALLLRPAVAPSPAQAQAVGADGQGAGRMILTSDSLYVYHEDGNLYRFDRNLNLQQRALRQVEPVRAPFDTANRVTFVTTGPR